MESAYAALQHDVVDLRADAYRDRLELVRLTTLVEGLLGHVQQLTQELVALRHELHAARSQPPQRDPALELLAAEVASLRATVAEQERRLALAADQLLAVRTESESAAPVPQAVDVEPAPPVVAPAAAAPPAPLAPAPAPASPAPLAPPAALPAAAAPPAPVPTSVPAAPAAEPERPLAPAATASVASPAPAPTAGPEPAEPAVVSLTGIPASVSAAAAEMGRREPMLAEMAGGGSVRTLAPPAPFEPEPARPDDARPLDDETVARLRMIRESFGR